MRILLIEANDVDRWVGGRAGGPNVHVLPIALLGLASWIGARVPGSDVRLVESSLDVADDARLASLLDDFRPELVGIRSINFFRDETRRLVRGVRAFADVPVVVGGPIAAALGPALFRWIPELSLAAMGEGERVLELLARGAPPERVPGLWRRGPQGPTLAGAALPLDDLDALPVPDYRLIDLVRYSKLLSYAYNQRRQGVLVTSRGCPFRCTYCFQPAGTRVRLRSAEHVLREMVELVERHEVRDFYVVDDIFNVNRRRALAIFDGLVARRLGARLYFVNGLRVDLCDDAFVDRMIEAGTVWVTFAIESASPRIAALIRKEVDLRQARDAIARTQRAGIVVNVNTMYGFPGETPADAEMTLEWLSQLPHPSLLPYHFNLRGYHGCEIVEQAAAAGWDREEFLASGFKSYNELPGGSPSFPRPEMMAHLIDYHRRFGLANREHLRWSIEVLRRVRYSDQEIADMYSVLLNRRLRSIGDLVAPAEPSC